MNIAIIAVAVCGGVLIGIGLWLIRRAHIITRDSGLTPPDKWGHRKCLSCGRVIGLNLQGHTNACPQLGRAELVRRLDTIEKELSEYRRKRHGSPWAIHMRKERMLWEAKFRAVKHENNALRRKLHVSKDKADQSELNNAGI